MFSPVIAIVGAGDLGTACALRLFRSGFKVIMIEKRVAQDIHYIRNFVGAVYTGSKEINGVRGKTVSGFLEQESFAFDNFEDTFLSFMLNNKEIPLLTEKDIDSINTVKITHLIITKDDLIDIPAVKNLLNRDIKTIGFEGNSSTVLNYTINNSGLVVYPFLRNIYTDNPLETKIKSAESIKSPIEGIFVADKEINSVVQIKDEIGKIDSIPIFSPYEGKLSGRLNSGAFVESGTEIAEITLLKDNENDGRKIPEKFILLSGAVLEALMFDMNLQKNGNS